MRQIPGGEQWGEFDDIEAVVAELKARGVEFEDVEMTAHLLAIGSPVM